MKKKTSWATAATNIHDAIDAASVPGALILVADGLWATGGRTVASGTTNRLAVTKPVTVQSVNGPVAAVIQGYQEPYITFGDSAVRCVYLTSGAALVGFTLTNGATRVVADGNGGGVLCASSRSGLSNCVLIGNSAYSSGGGAYFSMLNNCIANYNAASGTPNYDSLSVLNYSCSTPPPSGGVGNISVEPQLASLTHLGAGSPCQGAGNSAYATGLDIDGEAWAAPPSMGCDEFHAGAVTGPLS